MGTHGTGDARVGEELPELEKSLGKFNRDTAVGDSGPRRERCLRERPRDRRAGSFIGGRGYLHKEQGLHDPFLHRYLVDCQICPDFSEQ